MNTVILHIEYLLRSHDCVVLPGWGAFIARRQPAYFYDKDASLMLPPSRKLAFNAELSQDDGLLADSIRRREKISYRQAMEMIQAHVESFAGQLRSERELPFGSLGVFRLSDENTRRFYPSATAVDYASYGLCAITLRAVPQVCAGSGAEIPDVSHAEPPLYRSHGNTADAAEPAGLFTRWRRNAVGVAATVALLITAVLFVYNPIVLDNEPEKASMAPLPAPGGDIASGACVVSDAPPSEPDGLWPETQYVTAVASSAGIYSSDIPEPEQRYGSLRFDDTDPFCVVVASFASSDEALGYMASRTGCRLGVVSHGSEWLVYEATASTCGGAYLQKELLGNSRAWVCVR